MRGMESHTAHLGVALLEGEVVVAAGGELGPRDLPRDPDISELRIQHRADLRVQFAHGVNAALRRELEFQRELLAHRTPAISKALRAVVLSGIRVTSAG